MQKIEEKMFIFVYASLHMYKYNIEYNWNLNQWLKHQKNKKKVARMR